MKLSIKWHKKRKAIVHVRDDSQLEVKDTTIYVGDKWEAEDNCFRDRQNRSRRSV